MFDPVCGLRLRAAEAIARTYDGETHYFCSARCAAEFDADPARTLRERAIVVGALGTLWPLGWLFVRIVLGAAWVLAGWEKLGEAGWTDSPTGASVTRFLNGALERSTTGTHPEVPGWYADLVRDVFLPNADVFAYLVAAGEFALGAALLAGLFTRGAALAGIVMNLAFLWAGVSSTNPPLLLLGLAILFFGHNAGQYGLDGWVMPHLARRVGYRAWFALRAGAAILTVGAIAWLAFIARDWETWLAAALATPVAGLAWYWLRPRLPAGVVQPTR